jgi:murein DD-endopeptidase MepM/ murein hydrolase activator NlpD
MKKFITYLLLTSLSINVYFLYLKEKIDNHKKIQTFLNLFKDDTLSQKDSIVSIIPDKIIPPVKNIKITSLYGNRIHPVTKESDFHNGIDFSGNIGDTIFSSDSGYVKSIFYDEIGGNQIIIEYSNYTAGYAHLDEILINIDDKVKKYDMIGKMGDSGRTTGTHLHYTLKNDNGYIDPKKYLNI